jgi:hypothetical protein
VQIATDINFTTIVRNVNVTTTSYAPAGLSNSTFYYWRVLPKSPSCSGTLSSAYRFTTGQLTCLNEVSTDTPIDIPIVVTSPKGEYAPVEDIHLVINHIIVSWMQYHIMHEEGRI